MEGKDNIKELFSQKLGNYEAKVNPELWTKISSQVAAGATTTAATGLSVFAKVAIGLGISAAAITTVVLLTTSENSRVEKPNIEVQKEVPSVNSEKEADTQTQETIQTSAIQNELDANTTPLANPLVPSPQSTDRTPNPDFIVAPMRTKGVDKVNDVNRTEPQIVEGKVHLNTTNYGGESNTDPDQVQESVGAKSEPIKRFVNVFTPNGDRENDEFFLESEGLTDFSIVVFDPKGEIVFKSNDPNFRWDGRHMKTGEMVPSAENYMYMVSAYDSEGNPYPIYERLTIQR